MWVEEGLHVGNIATARHVAIRHVQGRWRRGRGRQEGVRVQHRLKRGCLWSQQRVWGRGWLRWRVAEIDTRVHWGLNVHLYYTGRGGGFVWGHGGLGQRLWGWRRTNTMSLGCWCCYRGVSQGAGKLIGCLHGLFFGRWGWTWGQAAAFGCLGFVSWWNLLICSRNGLKTEKPSQNLLCDQTVPEITSHSLYFVLHFTVCSLVFSAKISFYGSVTPQQQVQMQNMAKRQKSQITQLSSDSYNLLKSEKKVFKVWNGVSSISNVFFSQSLNGVDARREHSRSCVFTVCILVNHPL